MKKRRRRGVCPRRLSLSPAKLRSTAFRAARRSQAAFTLVELTAVLVVIGILAAFAIPRMADRTSFESRGFFDRAQAVVRYAQKIAIAQRQSPPKGPLFVITAPTQIRVCYDAACATPVIDPMTGAALTVNAPAGVTLAPATAFSFDGSGAPSIAAQLQITVSSTGAGDADRNFFIEARTGYVHE